MSEFPPEPMPEVVGSHEIRKMLGVNRQRIYQITCMPDFPEPFAELASGKIWRRDDVEEWMRLRRPERYAELRRGEAG